MKKSNPSGLFVTDLDGTLLNNKRQISSGDLQALNRLRELGYLTVIATGRSNYSFNKLMETLGYSNDFDSFPFDYLIFSTGTGIMKLPGNEILKSFSLDAGDVSYIADYLESLGLDYMIHNPVPDTRYFYYRYSSRNNSDFNARLRLYQDFATPLSSGHLNNSQGATELLCIVPQLDGHAVAKKIVSDLNQYSVIKATSPLDGKSIWVEIFAPGVNKSSAVEWLCQNVGVDRKQVFAVGNDYNDEDMLHWAERGFLVDNGPQEMRPHFEHVASNEAGGVTEAIERWLGKRI
ncbi:MAG: HAD family hydrolase [Desulforhopalus sp.]